MRLDNELMILNTNFSTLSTEQRNLEERLRSMVEANTNSEFRSSS